MIGKRKRERLEMRSQIEDLRERTESLRAENQTLSLAHHEIAARERLAEKLISSVPRGSMTSELYNSEFQSASKYQGAMDLYRSHWQGSNDHLRRLSRIAAFESPTAEAMLGGLVDIVVGGGLQLQVEPMWDLIATEVPGFSVQANDPDYQKTWRQTVERRHRLWWQSRQPSYNGDRTGYQIDRDAFRYLLQDGEYFVVLRYSSSRRGSPLTIQFIPPENVVGGTNPAAGNIIDNGIEYNKKGDAVAYHVLNDRTGTTTRISKYGSRSGRQYVIHNYLKTNEKQRRGVPWLSNVIHELTKLGDYEVLEIQAAVINALFAVWVQPPENEDGEPVLGAGAVKKSGATADPSGYDPAITETYVANANRLDFSTGGVMLDALPAGHKVESFDTKRPNKGFNDFFHAVKTNLAASKRQPVSIVDLVFNNSYSGARGELLVFWMTVTNWRRSHGRDFHDIVYPMWMWGEVERDRIEAPGFGYDEFIRQAYCNAEHIGNQRPDIDPYNSVRAHKLEEENGYKSGEQITVERGGGDQSENLQALRKKREEMATIPTIPVAGMDQGQGANQSPGIGNNNGGTNGGST